MSYYFVEASKCWSRTPGSGGHLFPPNTLLPLGWLLCSSPLPACTVFLNSGSLRQWWPGVAIPAGAGRPATPTRTTGVQRVSSKLIKKPGQISGSCFWTVPQHPLTLKQQDAFAVKTMYY
ncbi:unnamed protein product [Urochloa humidicola]